MFEYVIRRLLLMIPVFFGSTLLVFYILQSVPDGPFEQAVKQIKMAQMQSGEGGAATGGSDKNSMEISEDVLEKIRKWDFSPLDNLIRHYSRLELLRELEREEK